MPNIQNPGGNKPSILAAPGQLWGKVSGVLGSNSPQPPSQPANQPPTQPPAFGLPSLLKPDQLVSTMGRSGITNNIPNPLPLVNPSSQDLKGQMNQLQALMKSEDSNTLRAYGVQYQSDAQGRITGYLLHGQPATAQQVQQHLLPMATRLHQQLNQTKAMIDQAYQSFILTANSQLTQMTSTEQTATKIQLQAVNAIYQNFVNRLNQVDALIK